MVALPAAGEHDGRLPDPPAPSASSPGDEAPPPRERPPAPKVAPPISGVAELLEQEGRVSRTASAVAPPFPLPRLNSPKPTPHAPPVHPPAVPAPTRALQAADAFSGELERRRSDEGGISRSASHEETE
jgi:hypothetical protein